MGDTRVVSNQLGYPTQAGLRGSDWGALRDAHPLHRSRHRKSQEQHVAINKLERRLPSRFEMPAISSLEPGIKTDPLTEIATFAKFACLLKPVADAPVPLVSAFNRIAMEYGLLFQNPNRRGNTQPALKMQARSRVTREAGMERVQ